VVVLFDISEKLQYSIQRQKKEVKYLERGFIFGEGRFLKWAGLLRVEHCSLGFCFLPACREDGRTQGRAVSPLKLSS
jgi:hypothetical protein